MNKIDKIKIQIEISIFYIIFIFTLISVFPEIKTTGYGISTGTDLSVNIIAGIDFLVWTIYSTFAFIFSSSIFIIRNKESKFLYFINQLFFVLSSILIFLVLIFIISFIPLHVKHLP